MTTRHALAQELYERLSWSGCAGSAWSQLSSGARVKWLDMAIAVTESAWLTQVLAEACSHELAEAASEVEEIERIGSEVVASLSEMELVKFRDSPLRKLYASDDPRLRPRIVVAAWLRGRGETRSVFPTAYSDVTWGEIPESEPPPPSVIHDLLLLVQDEFSGEMPCHDEIAAWSNNLRREVADWATAVHLRASDNDVEIPPAPSVLEGE